MDFSRVIQELKFEHGQICKAISELELLDSRRPARTPRSLKIAARKENLEPEKPVAKPKTMAAGSGEQAAE